MNSRLKEVAFAARTLRKAPGVTVTAVLTLALGIAGNTAIFTVTSALLLRPVPYNQPQRLVVLSKTQKRHAEETGPFSLDRFELIRDNSRSFASIAAFADDSFIMTGHGDAQQLPAARVSPAFLEVLGIRPELGRSFLPQEGEAGGKPVVMISDSLWRSGFGAQPGILGESIELDGQPFTVVGVTPPDFRFPLLGPVQVWSPRFFELSLLKPAQIRAGAGYLEAIARLRPSTTLAVAAAEMEVLNERYGKEFSKAADADPDASILAEELQQAIVKDIRPALLVLTAAVGLVLLIACANVAGLLLSRALHRRKEMAVRIALGAGRSDIVRQLLTESLLLATIAGLVGIGLSIWATSSLAHLGESYLPQGFRFQFDWRVLIFVLLISLLCGVLFGISPALQTAGIDPNSALREEGRGISEAPGRVQMRSLLVVTQVALSTVLLIAAGLLLRSFARLTHVDPGFDPAGVLTMSLSLPTTKYPAGERQARFYDEVIRRISALPGVSQVALSGALPLNPSRLSPALPEGQPAVPLAQRPLLILESISPGWFRTMRTPLIAGREFTLADTSQAPEVIIVNQTLAQRFWPGENPIGKHVLIGRQPQPAEVVGVAADVRNSGLAIGARPQLYLTYSQLPWANMNLLIRTTVDPETIIKSVKQQIAAIDPDQPVTKPRTLDEVLDSSRAQPRYLTLLLSIFSAAALVLAAVGIYGLLAYSVAQQRHELGVRLALGARKLHILRLILAKSLSLALAGIAVGMAAAFAVTRAMGSVLYGTSTRDLRTFALTPLVLLAIALLAGWIPARRALAADPREALHG